MPELNFLFKRHKCSLQNDHSLDESHLPFQSGYLIYTDQIYMLKSTLNKIIEQILYLGNDLKKSPHGYLSIDF